MLHLGKQTTHLSSSIFFSENFPSSEAEDENENPAATLLQVEEGHSSEGGSPALTEHHYIVKPINEIFICFGHEDFFDGYQDENISNSELDETSIEQTPNQAKRPNQRQLLMPPSEDFDIMSLFDEMDRE